MLPAQSTISASEQMPKPSSSNQEGFVFRWQKSSASERANYALFLSELCDFLDVPRPEPSQADEIANTYVIDKAVFYKELDGSTTTNFIDLYKRNCFVLEAKQGSDPVREHLSEFHNPEPRRRVKRGTAVRGKLGWDTAMLRARGQAERYAKALPSSEGWPPFLVVVDVGHSVELFADFSLTGKAYLPFPGPRSFRILLEDLEIPDIRERLREFGSILTRSTRLVKGRGSLVKLLPSWPLWRGSSSWNLRPRRSRSSSPGASSPPSLKMSAFCRNVGG
jgi:hypothetical protein